MSKTIFVVWVGIKYAILGMSGAEKILPIDKSLVLSNALYMHRLTFEYLIVSGLLDIIIICIFFFFW